MPLSGTARSCSLTSFSAAPAAAPPANASARSVVTGSSRTGYRLVNQPTVRDRSAPPTVSSSRPCPSRSIRAVPDALPRQRAQASANAASSTSLTSARNAAGTRVSTCSVTSTGSVTVRCSAVA
ncbi:hypothetical protein SGLAM104S_01432 [Streptomyces glaucescens]